MKKLFYFLSALFLSASLVLANDLLEGLSAYERQDFLKASEHFDEACTQGSVEACYNLAIMYDAGIAHQRML